MCALWISLLVELFNNLGESFPDLGTPPHRLPLRCQPFPGESLNSLVMRLAERNGGVRPSELARGTLRKFPALSLGCDEALRLSVWAHLRMEAVIQLCEVDFSGGGDGSESLPKQIMGQWLRAYDFISGRHVCPACLREAPFDRRIWTVGSLCGCTSHDNPFVNRCPRCDLMLTFDGPLMECACGQRLDRIVPGDWQPGERAQAAYIGARLSGLPGPSLPRLDEVRLTDAIALIDWFGFPALAGPVEGLMELARSRRTASYIPLTREAPPGCFQPELPGLARPGGEAVAAVMREAAGYRLRPGEKPLDAILAAEAAVRRRRDDRLGLDWFGPDGSKLKKASRVWNVPLGTVDCWFSRGPSGRLLGPSRHPASAVVAIALDIADSDGTAGSVWAPMPESLPLDRGWRSAQVPGADAVRGATLYEVTPGDMPPFFVVSDEEGVREGFLTVDIKIAAAEAAREAERPHDRGMSPGDVLAFWRK
jgi:hypothetical protein